MRNPLLYIRIAVVLVSLALAGLFVFQVFVKPDSSPALEKMTFSQTGPDAPPGASASRMIDQADRLQSFSELMGRYSIRVQSDVPVFAPCAGEVVTTAAMVYVDGSKVPLSFTSCASTDLSTFNARATRMIAGWGN